MTFVPRLKLGTGGMGEVWLAEMRLPTGEVEAVALKRIRADRSDRPEHLQQFEREARITSLLRHPHIVALRRYGVDAEGPFLALEFVEGRSAKDLEAEAVRRGKALPVQVALSLARDAARGLAHAHAFRDDAAQVDHIVHRDVSPDNILVGYGGVAKVTDFGIAKVVGGTTLTGTDTARGKYGYMAPELFDGQEADTRSDVFAFGATLFRLLTGTSAFPGKTEAELLRSVLHAQPVRVSSLVEVPAAIDGWIDRALAKDPRERPANLEALLALLEREVGAGAEAEVAALMRECFPPGEDARRAQVEEVVSGTRTASRGARRPRWPLALGAAVGVGVGVGAAGFGVHEWRDRRVVAAGVADAGAPEFPEPSRGAVAVDAGAPEFPEPSRGAVAVERSRGTGRVFIKSSPFAQVSVDGTPRGGTPLKLTLPAGEHTVVLDFGDGQTRKQVVRVVRGKEVVVKGFLNETR